MTDLSSPFLITLPQPYPGLEQFIGSWVIPGPPTLVVDPGPRASVNLLVDELHSRGIDRVDYLLLSHIHIDHAGGLGPFLARFPQARAVAHAEGIRHLADPARLWAGSLKTLKTMAEAYGPIDPAPTDRLIPHPDFILPGLEILETPGHAPHHLTYVYDGKIFAGELAGIYLPFWDGLYLRPPTPPRFFFEQALASVDRMRSLPDRPIYFAHLGAHPSSREILERYREQLHLWLRIAGEALKEHPEAPLASAAERLLAEDPCLKNFSLMDSAEQQRERTFLANSLEGFIGYLKDRIYIPKRNEIEKNKKIH